MNKAPADRHWSLDRGRAAWFVLALLVLLPGLGNCPLWDMDEAIFSAAAQEMFARSDWLVPTFNEQLFAHKPPVMFWGMLASMQAWGVNEFAVRFPSAVWGLITLFATASIGNRILGKRAGHGAALILVTSMLFVLIARAATPDAALMALFTLIFAILAFQWFDSAGNPQPTPLRGRAWWGAYLLMGVAILVKGPIGLVLPTASALVFCGWQRWASWADGTASIPAASSSNWRVRLEVALRCGWNAWTDVAPVRGAMVALALAAPWFVAVGWATQGAWTDEFFGVHNFGRFLKPMERHAGSPLYYLPAALVGCFPWSCFALPLLWSWVQGIFTSPSSLPEQAQIGPEDSNFGQPGRQAALRFLACWAGVVFGFFSIAATKLPSYVLPAYPALALAMVHCLEWQLGSGWSQRVFQIGRQFAGALPQDASSPQTGHPRWLLAAVVSLLITGVAMTCVLPWVGLRFLNGESTLLLIALPVLVLGGVGTWLLLAKPDRGYLLPWGFAGCGFCFCLILFQLVAPRVAQHSNMPRLGQSARAELSGGGTLLSYRLSHPSLTYYARHSVTAVELSELTRQLKQSNSRQLLLATNSVAWKAVDPTLQAAFETVQTWPNFLKPGEVLLLKAKMPTVSVATQHDQPQRK